MASRKDEDYILSIKVTEDKPKELGLDFRRYLERGKFNQELTDALLALYSEREWPQNPNEQLASSCNLTIMEDKSNELTEAKDKIKELEMVVARLREELFRYKHEKPGKKSKD
ncbi:hypothetical protein V9T40_006831 [Parthenolecanium corni]|uniref:Uncharacterized protein n=1 Tax=Parthenolecanium corni TaxID=536013 RepID=A0AAN9TQ84_9HEMI